MRSRGLFVFAVVMGALPAAGCDTGLTQPPRRAELITPKPNLTSPGSYASKQVVLVLPAEETSDVVIWDTIARQESGLLSIGFSSVKPFESTPPPGAQANLIREAAKRGSALIVITDRSPETTAALAELDPKKTPVILLGRALPDSPEAKKVQATFVTSPPWSDGAKKMIAAALEDCRKRAEKSKLAPEAVLIRSSVKDESSDERAQALLDAAKAQGVKVVAEETFDGTADGIARLMERVKKDHSKLAILLCAEEVALSGVTVVRRDDMPKSKDEADEKGSLLMVGYVTTRSNLNLARLGQASALIDRNIHGMARKAVATASSRLDGQTVPNRIVVDTPLVRSTQNPSETLPIH